MSDNKEKLKALQLTIDKLEKTYGKGTVMKLNDQKVMDVPAISTGKPFSSNTINFDPATLIIRKRRIKSGVINECL